jgi:hypothetical protein
LLLNCSKDLTTTSMKHLGGIGIARIMFSGYPGLHTWLSTQDMCGGYHLGVHLWVATQGGIPGYQHMVCGGYHLRVIHVLLSNYPELHNLAINPGFEWWLSSGGYLDH